MTYVIKDSQLFRNMHEIQCTDIALIDLQETEARRSITLVVAIFEQWRKRILPSEISRMRVAITRQLIIIVAVSEILTILKDRVNAGKYSVRSIWSNDALLN